ncbi:MAG: GyrI-like domain-containing protein [Paracoccaceae bacterium]|nr:GyrI-like domain-containing protein [Paracoccaceae bacterium]
MSGKLDFKKSDRALYTGKRGRWDDIEVPKMVFLSIDGQGDPNGPDFARAVGALYPMAYGLKFAMKAREADFVVAPLEAAWWADDPAAFREGARQAWKWTAMMRVPDDITGEIFVETRETVQEKLAKKADGDPEAVGGIRLEPREEGRCLQTLHIGPYTEEAETLRALHDEVMPAMGVTFNGPHHEIYLSDARRVEPAKLRTLLRQPVRAI